MNIKKKQLLAMSQKFFLVKEGFSKAANEKYITEATENVNINSTLNKGINSLITSEYL